MSTCQRVNARSAENVTPLHLASEMGEPDVARLLLKHGADIQYSIFNIHARDDDDRTPFMISTKHGRDDVMDLLLEHGAEDHRTDSKLETL